MIGNNIKGRGFRGCLNYVLEKDGAELIGGNMSGRNARELSREFAASRALNPDLQRAVYHCPLSLAPGEHLSDEQWKEIADRYMTEMDFKSSQYVLVRHRDTDHEHVHIVASRIGMDGRTVSDSWDHIRTEKALRGIERDYGLRQLEMSRDVEKHAPTREELKNFDRTSEPSTRVETRIQLQAIIDGATRDQPTMGEFLARVESQGVRVRANIQSTGNVKGISYELEGFALKGSDVGRAYSWGGLQKMRGVSYDEGRDLESVRAATDRGTRAVETREPDVEGREREVEYRHGQRGRHDEAPDGRPRMDARRERAVDTASREIDRSTELGESTQRKLVEADRAANGALRAATSLGNRSERSGRDERVTDSEREARAREKAAQRRQRAERQAKGRQRQRTNERAAEDRLREEMNARRIDISPKSPILEDERDRMTPEERRRQELERFGDMTEESRQAFEHVNNQQEIEAARAAQQAEGRNDDRDDQEKHRPHVDEPERDPSRESSPTKDDDRDRDDGGDRDR